MSNSPPLIRGSKVGKCSVCEYEGILSFEHIPPKGAFNNKPVKSRDSRHLLPNEDPHLFGKFSKINKGMGGYRLCAKCNNTSGSLFSPEYINLVRENIETIYVQGNKNIIKFQSKIAPHRFAKQVLVMLLCADRGLGMIRNSFDSSKNIFSKCPFLFPKGWKLYMYCTFSSTHRNAGMMMIGSFRKKNTLWYGEVNYHPFGFLLTYECDPPIRILKDITHFTTYEFNTEMELDFSLPNLKITDFVPGHYSNIPKS